MVIMSPELWIESKNIKSNSNSHGDQMIYDIKIPAGSTPFGVWLVTTLAKQDKTIQDLAKAMEVEPATVRQWCRYSERLSMQRLMSIVDNLVDDPVLWRPHLDKSVYLISQFKDPNNKKFNQYKNRRLSK